jgi:UDP-2,4-diacetamido-2,4,6-trideoxy-beta-L-altropyranose hydrolase
VGEGKDKRTLLIRADANVAMGTGHVMRCLALAQAWQDAGGSATFTIADPSSQIRERLLKESLGILAISAAAGTEEDARQTTALARQHATTWVVVDGYQFGADYQRALKLAGFKVLFLDDYGHASHYCADLVLNQNISADESAYRNREPHTRLLLGPRYSLLRREFNTWHGWRREIVPVGYRVLVTMGGSDPDNFTGRVIDSLASIENANVEATVVVGGSSEHFESLEQRAIKVGKKIVLRRDVSNMAELMAEADIAISAAGTTCWEICLMGLPAILIDLAENQTPVARELDRRGCAIHLGSPQDVSTTMLAIEVKRLLDSKDDRQALSVRGRELVDGEGAKRVLSALRGTELRLRPAQESDSRLLWEWANDAEVRAASFSSTPIPWPQHVAWFAEKLEQSRCRILIAENSEGTLIGQIRFDTRADGDSEIDVSIAKAWRGRGLAVPLIVQAIRMVLSAGGFTRFHAFVKAENDASVKAFEGAGFKRLGSELVHGNEAIHLVYEAN